MKKKLFYFFLSFFVPIIIFCLFSFIKHGNMFFYRFFDVNLQYIPLFKYFKGFLYGNNCIFYSFFKSLGGNMLSTFAYYLSSPLNSLLFFFDDLTLFLNVICILKIGLCGLFMYLFLYNKYPTKYMFNLIFSLCYALMGYNLLYINNVFWFDVVYISPVVMLGIDRILKNKGSLIYIFALFYAIICNFYIAFSLGIFSFIYFFYNLFILDLNKKRYIKIFFSRTILVLLFSSFLLFPTLLEMINLNSRNDIVSFFNNDFYNIPYLFYKTLVGSSTFFSNNVMFSNSPNIYCSVFCIVLNLAFFSNNKISNKEKIITLIIYLFFILSMIFYPLYMLWHGFSNTNGNYYRFSFLWTFFRILIAYKSLIKISFFRINLSFILYCVVFFLLLVFSMFLGDYSFYFNGYEVIISSIFIIIYIIIIYFKYFKFLFFIILVELCINLYFCYNFDIIPNVSIVFYFDNSDYCIKDVDKSFFRAEFNNYNNGLYCNYGSISSYLSTSNDDLNNFLSNAGLMNYLMYTSGNNYSTDLLYDLLGLKYIEKDGEIVENNNFLSIGYMINYDYVKYDNNSLLYQQDILNSMINDNYIFFSETELYKIDDLNYYYFNDDYDKYVFIVDENKTLLDINPEVSKLKVSKATFKVFRLKKSSELKSFISLKINCELGDLNCVAPNIYLYDLNRDTLNEAIDVLKEQQLNVTYMEKNKLEGNINVKKDNQYLFLSIPYERGWNVYVDGKKVKYEKLYDAFIGIKLDKGYHEIKMVFYPYGLNIGILISGCSFICFIVYLYYNRKRKLIKKY